MVVRSRAAAELAHGARLSLTSTPEGRTTVLAQAAVVGWPADLARSEARTRASGDTAAVEVAFDAAPGRTYT